MQHPEQKNIGLFFGSFNPVHAGHVALANFILEYSDLKEIWFIISPCNPFKDADVLIDEQHRFKMVEMAIAEEPRFHVSNIEFEMPRPSYTIDTLELLSSKYPDQCFTMIMGGDNLQFLDRWKDSEKIIRKYKILIYPRPGYEVSGELLSETISLIEAPNFDISSTLLRKSLAEGKHIPYLLPPGVFKYIVNNDLYKG